MFNKTKTKRKISFSINFIVPHVMHVVLQFCAMLRISLNSSICGQGRVNIILQILLHVANMLWSTFYEVTYIFEFMRVIIFISFHIYLKINGILIKIKCIRKWNGRFLEERASDIVIRDVFRAQSNILDGKSFFRK